MKQKYFLFISLIFFFFVACKSHDQHLEFKIKLSGNAVQNDLSILKDRVYELSGEQPEISEISANEFHFKLRSFQDSAIILQAIQAKGEFEISESYDVRELYPILQQINADLVNSKLVKQLLPKSNDEFVQNNPLFSIFRPSSDAAGNIVYGATIGHLLLKDTAILNQMFMLPEAQSKLPLGIKFLYGKTINNEISPLFALKPNPNNDLSIHQKMFEDVRVKKSDQTGDDEILIKLASSYQNRFSELTEKNIQKALLICFDQEILSAPIVQSKVSGGRFIISSNFSRSEALCIATCMKLGALSCKPIVKEFGFVKNN